MSSTTPKARRHKGDGDKNGNIATKREGSSPAHRGAGDAPTTPPGALPDVRYEKESDPFPFRVNLQFSPLRRVQIFLFAIFVMPIRVVVCAAFLGTACVVAVIAVLGRPMVNTTPLTSWRKALKKVVVFLVRCAWFCAGVHWVRTKGVRAKTADAPLIVLASHQSFTDTLAGAALGFPGVVSVIENLRIPIVGRLFLVNESIFVDRSDPDSRKKSAEEIRKRAASKGLWPQLAIFPEGTCTNTEALLPFKPGGFTPGVPVQPCIVRYHGTCPRAVCWVNTGPGLLALFLLTCCLPHTSMELEYLPVYNPSEQEKKDPVLFANNIRQLFCRTMDVPPSAYGYDILCKLQKSCKSDRSIGAMFKNIFLKGEVSMPTHEEIMEVLDREK